MCFEVCLGICLPIFSCIHVPMSFLETNYISIVVPFLFVLSSHLWLCNDFGVWAGFFIVPSAFKNIFDDNQLGKMWRI